MNAVKTQNLEIDDLARMMMDEFTGLRKDLSNEIQEFRTEFKEFRTETRERLVNIETRLLSIESELRNLRRDIAYLQARVESHDGYRKEIDFLISRQNKLEKEFGQFKK